MMVSETSARWRTVAILAVGSLSLVLGADPPPPAPTSCIVYKRGEGAPTRIPPPLGEGWGWFVVILFGILFTALTVAITQYEQKNTRTAQTSETFNTAGRNIGIGLTASVIVSQWTWAATLLMSSNMGWRVGVSGPFWYASGATVQILLFAILAIQVKRRASHMHTFMEIVKARFGTVTHCIMIFFALLANMIVTAMLLLGGAATISDLTGMSAIWAAFLIPLLSCWIYTMYGGLKATFFASYVHTTVIFLMLLIFTFKVYASSGDGTGLWGSAGAVYDGLEKASFHAFSKAVRREADLPNILPKDKFSSLGSIIENDGECWTQSGSTGKACYYYAQPSDAWCCSGKPTLAPDTYCIADNEDCIDLSATSHFKSTDCGAGERCVTSFLTMGSSSGLLFGITNIVGNFGTVFVDQAYWQSAVAAKPKSAVLGFLLGGMVWFAVPFCMATTNGLVGRALTTHPDLPLGPLYIDAAASGAGLTPARVLSHILGAGGAFVLLLQLFMAITSTGSAEIIAVSSILTYDIYFEYIHPELKQRREALRKLFFKAVKEYEDNERVPIAKVNPFMEKLIDKKFFPEVPPDPEVCNLAKAINDYTVDGSISTKDLYACVNRTVASGNIEGVILLRVSKFFTGVFAVFMGFLAVFLQTLGFSLGWVYMTMGVLIGSAVGPASLTILLEKASSLWIGAGAVFGLLLGLFSWMLKAALDNEGVISYDTLGQDWPWVVGNLTAILGGLLISLVGSLAFPDEDFKWDMLNDRIPLVDDIEPPKDTEESDAKLQQQFKIALGASLVLTFVLLVLWPLPIHGSGGVFSKGSFTFWVVLEVFWALVASIVIIFLPIYETLKDFKTARENKEKSEAEKSRMLTNGENLLIPSSAKKEDDEPPKFI